MSNRKATSTPIARMAARILHDNSASEIAKSLAGSALSQVNRGKETSKEMETLASAVLRSTKYSEETKELAGTVLSQSDKNR